MNDRDRINRAVKRDIARALISNPFTLIPVERPEREIERERGEGQGERKRESTRRCHTRYRSGEGGTHPPHTAGDTSEPGHFENHRVALL